MFVLCRDGRDDLFLDLIGLHYEEVLALCQYDSGAYIGMLPFEMPNLTST
jgi:hypothetical protein